MGDVAGVAVAKEHRGPGVLRHVPAVQPRAVGRLKPSILKRQPGRPPLPVRDRAIGKKISEFSKNIAATTIRRKTISTTPPIRHPATTGRELVGVRGSSTTWPGGQAFSLELSRIALLQNRGIVDTRKRCMIALRLAVIASPPAAEAGMRNGNLVETASKGGL